MDDRPGGEEARIEAKVLWVEFNGGNGSLVISDLTCWIGGSFIEDLGIRPSVSEYHPPSESHSDSILDERFMVCSWASAAAALAAGSIALLVGPPTGPPKSS